METGLLLNYRTEGSGFNFFKKPHERVFNAFSFSDCFLAGPHCSSVYIRVNIHVWYIFMFSLVWMCFCIRGKKSQMKLLSPPAQNFTHFKLRS